MEEMRAEIDAILSSIKIFVQSFADVLNEVGDIVAEINGFVTTVEDLISSDIFDGYEINNFYDFFVGE